MKRLRMGTKILATQLTSSKTSGRAFCTFPLWNCEEEGQRESIYEKCHPVYSGECQQSIWQGMSGGGGCSEADALPSTISVLKAEEWMGRRGIVEGQEEIAKVTPPLRLALSRHPQ